MKRFLMLSLVVLGVVVLPPTGVAHAQDTLDIAIPSSINTLDPAKSKIGEEYILNHIIYSGLTRIDQSGEVVPELAESWEASDDQKTWTFELRDDVNFHDGSEFNANDVKVSIERILDPKVGSVARANFKLISDIKILDEDTIRFDLKIPYSGFAALLSTRAARIVPSGEVKELGAHPIGTGPFKLKEYIPGDHVTLVKNEDYFVGGMPKIDKLVFHIIPETASAITGLETGAIDIVWNVPAEELKGLKKNPEVVVDSVPTSTWDGVIMNAAKAPFDDVLVRKAVQAAIDKAAMAKIATFGNATPTHTMIPPSSPYYNDEIKIDGPNLAKAKKLLAKAGYSDGFDITIYVPIGRPSRVRVGLAVREMLRPVGINVQIQKVPWDKFITDIEGKAAFYVDGFFARPTIDTSVYPFYHSTGSWNTQLWNYDNPAVDKVLDKARRAKSQEERIRLYKKFQKLVLEHPAGVIPYVKYHTDAYRKNVKNFSASPMMWLNLRKTEIK